MMNVTYFYPYCKTWIEEKAHNIDQEIEECPYCSAIHRLEFKFMAPVWRWHVELPAGWQFPQWESVKLISVQVPQPVLCCKQCGQFIKVIPSFMQRGTTLTLPALIFVALAYEFSVLTWRKLVQTFCDEENGIAHSTLYKAVHGLGRLIHSDLEFRKRCQQHFPAIEAIRSEAIPDESIPSDSIPGESIPHWPPPKSLYTHTVIREKGVRLLMGPLWAYHRHISEVFERFVIALERVFVHSSKAIPVLYKKGWREKGTALNTA